MFVLLLRRVDDVLPICVPALRGKIPPPLVPKAKQAQRKDQPPAPRATLSNPTPSFQFSWKFPRCSAVPPASALQKFPRAVIPFHHPRAFPLPAPDAPNVPAGPIAFPPTKRRIAFPDRTSVKQRNYKC